MCLDLKTRPRSGRYWFGRLAGEERGVELFEAALVLPLLLTLLIGIFWMGRAYSVYETMTRAAREGARALVLTNCASCGNAAYAASSVQMNYVNPVLTSAAIDPTQVSGYSSTYVWLDPGASPPQQCGVAISFSYPFQLIIPFTSLNLTNISISTHVQMRMENQPATCSAGSAVP